MAFKAVSLCAVVCLLAPLGGGNEVTDEVNKVIDELKAEIEQMKAEINKDGAAASAAVAGELNGAYQSLDAQVEDAVKKAAEAGIDISACTQKLNSTVTSGVNTHTSNAVTCITKEMTDALDACEQELQAVETAEKDVQDGEDALKACNKLSTWKKVKCIAEETAKLVSEAKSIKDQIVKGKDTLEHIAANYTQDIQGCENKELNGAESDAKQAGEDFVLCVLAKGIHL